MEMSSVFIGYSNMGLADYMRAQRKLSDININSYYQFSMGAKGGDVWQ
jgi:hypothetical protein